MFGGRKIKNRYIIEALIHRGSLSSVYMVSDIDVPGKQYILKQIVDTKHNPAEKKLAEFLFLKEVEKLKEIKYEGIARIYDGFVESGRFFVLEEYIEGINLEKILETRKSASFPDREIFEYLQQVTDIILYLASIKGETKIFRDIRPSSFILTSSGKIHLVDHGFSHVFLPMEDLAMRLKDFNSPEVVRREKYDELADVYSIGAIFYYLVTGKVPGEFGGKPPGADRFSSTISKSLSKLLEDCMESRNKRIQSPLFLKHRIVETGMIVEQKEREQRIRQEEYRLTKSEREARLKIYAVIFILILLAIPAAIFGYRHYALNKCVDNCKEIEIALKRYAADNKGIYPKKLTDLVPAYLKKIPSCPATWKDTYSSSYKSYNFLGLKYCRFYCCGKGHASCGVPKDFPLFNTYDGIITKPGDEYKENPVEKLLEAYTKDEEGKYEEAVEQFRDLTVMDEKTLRERAGIEKYIIFWNMARVLEKMKKPLEAKEKYRTAAVLLVNHNLYSFNKTIISTLIKDMKRLGESRYALHFFNTLTNKYVMERHNPDIRIVSDMVEIYEELGRKSFAVKLLRLYHSKAPRNEKVFVSAEIYRLRGQTGRARTAYRKYIHLYGQKTMYEKAVKESR